MAGNIWVDLEERSGAEAAEAVEACEDFVEDYGKADPLVRVIGRCWCCGCFGEEGWVGADGLDEGVLE